MFAASCEDANAMDVVAGPQGPWQLTQTSIKPWPCCRHTHPAIDAALEISAQLDSSVKEARLSTYQAALDVCDRPEPDNEYQAKFSLQHCVAVALEKGNINFDSFSDTARQAATATRHSIHIGLNEEIDADYPGDWGCELEVVSVEGQTLHASRRHCKGDPELPLSGHDIIAKAESLLDYAGVDKSSQQQLIKYILDLPNKTRIPSVIELLDFSA